MPLTTVHVQRNHIIRGRRDKPTCCPVALAANSILRPEYRAMMYDAASGKATSGKATSGKATSDPVLAILSRDDQSVLVSTKPDDKAVRFAVRFDLLGRYCVGPFWFVWDVPGEYLATHQEATQ